MSVTVDAIKELAKASINGSCGDEVGGAVNFLLFGGSIFPGMVDGATLAAKANVTAAEDITTDLAMNVVTDALAAGLQALLEAVAKEAIEAAGYTAEGLSGVAMLLLSPTSIAPDPPALGANPSGPVPVQDGPATQPESSATRSPSDGLRSNPFSPPTPTPAQGPTPSTMPQIPTDTEQQQDQNQQPEDEEMPDEAPATDQAPVEQPSFPAR